MRNIDFSSWQGVVATLLGLALVTLIGVGIRLLMMFTIQGRRERMNRQINERLRTLIMAYKVLGGSFTGNLTVNPHHLRELRHQTSESDDKDAAQDIAMPGSDRSRRIRDAVEGALADIVLLGTPDHVRLAQRAISQLLAGQSVHTDELVVSLRAFIRHALDLDPIPAELVIPMQGPARLIAPAKGKGERGNDEGGGGKGGGMGMGGGGGNIGGGTPAHEDADTQHE